MPRLVVHICGLPPPADGCWYLTAYLEHKCDNCPMAAWYARRQPGGQIEYRCAKCKEADHAG